MSRGWRGLAALAAVALVGATLVEADAVAVPQRTTVDPNGILKYGEDLTVTGSGGTITLDPASMSGSPFNVAPARLIYDTLVRLDQDGNPLPGLATAWKFPDDRTIELTLRKGVRFQDGTQ